MTGRRKLLIGVSVAVWIAMNALIWGNETRVSQGERLYLGLKVEETRLQTSDGAVPLRYEIAEAIDASRADDRASGTVVVRVDQRGIATFARAAIGDGLGDSEHLLEWRYRRGVAVGPTKCRLDSDRADRIERATYAELAVAESGAPILVGLRDEELEPLEVGCGVGR